VSIPSKCITEITGELVSETEKVIDIVKERLEVVMDNLWCYMGINRMEHDEKDTSMNYMKP
jgi:hypothetical protein